MERPSRRSPGTGSIVLAPVNDVPTVSVVIPAFNAGTTIARAVRSMLAQTYRDLEVLVVDDGSTDGTRDVVRGIDDPRLRLVARDHAGVARAANAGTAAARAPLIARMDSDDVSHPDRIARQLGLIEERRLDVVGCRVRIVDGFGEPVASLARYALWINEETLDPAAIRALRFVELPLVNPTILARRTYFARGFRDDDLPEDYDLLLRAAAEGTRFGKVDEVLFDWTDGPGRLTRTDARYSAAAFDRCRRRHLLAGPLDGVRTVDLWGVGRTGKPWLRWLQGEGITVRHAYEVGGGRIGKTIAGVVVRHVDDLVPPDGTPLVIAVGAAGARELIREPVERRGYVVGGDAWFVA